MISKPARLPFRLLAKGLAALVIAFVMLVGFLGQRAEAKDPVYTSLLSSVAVGGYDAVAYFKANTAVEGSSDHEVTWNGATWRFSSAENKALFEAMPEAYAPQYGGYCAWAVSEGYTAPADPQAWKIENGKLYLNYNHDVQKKWARDIPGNVQKADANWPKVLQD